VGEVEEGQTWLPVIGKSLAFLCLKSAQMDGKSMLEKAVFLQGLGLNRADAAGILGTSSASLAELQRQAKKRKAGAKSRGKSSSSKASKR
jgi:hypothetical protein